MCINVVGVKCEFKHFNRNIAVTSLLIWATYIFWIVMNNQQLQLLPTIFPGGFYCKNLQWLFFFCYVCIVFYTKVRDASVCAGPFLWCDSHFSKTPSACQFHFLSCWDMRKASQPALVFSLLVFPKKKSFMLPWSQPGLGCHWPPSPSTKDETKRKFSSWTEHLNLVSFVSMPLLVSSVWITDKKTF